MADPIEETEQRRESKDRVKQALLAAQNAVSPTIDPTGQQSLSVPGIPQGVDPLSGGGSPVAPTESVNFSGPSTERLGGLDPNLQWIIGKESSGRTTAQNPTSSAFGLGQLIRSNREKYAAALGISNPNTTNFDEQLAMMEAYVADRYGTPAEAVKFWKQHGWY